MTSLATITSKNQLTIPKEIIDALGLAELRKVLVSVRDKSLVIQPVPSRVDELAGVLSYLSSGKTADLKKVRKRTQQKVAAQIAKEGL